MTVDPQAAKAATVSGAASVALQLFGTPLSGIFAAFAGAMLALTFLEIPAPPALDGELPAHRHIRHVRNVAAAVAVGFLGGVYGSVMVGEYYNWAQPMRNGAAFFLALLAQGALSILFQRGRDWADSFVRRFGGGA